MTLNEERNVEFCLRSVRPWCNEVIVADNYSDDRTPEIARRYADRVLSNERLEGFDAGRKKAFDSANGDWILSIDADEVVTPKLARWIRQYVDSDPKVDVVLVPRANVFLGRWIRSSHWWPGKPRLFRRGAIEVSSTLHQGLVPVAGARLGRVPRDPDLSMWHFALTSVSSMVEKTNRYTTIEARQALAAGRTTPGALELIRRPLRALAPYIVRRGYRDGMAGLVYTVDRMYYSFLSAVKRWDEANAGQRQQLYDDMREQILADFPPASTQLATVPAAARSDEFVELVASREPLVN